MSVDMNTYGREIRNAIDDVTADSGNDWCIFGYEGKSYTLKVICQGDGGVEEMVDEFHGSKIMYGYCKVKEPNTGLPKFVFINWQGEGAPERMKFACGSHSSEVQRVCRITHVTINARDESDVEPNDIISRVVKASGSQHSVIKSSNNAAPVEPVSVKPPPKPSKGSVYKKVNPTSEILNRERDAYWQKVEAEDRKAKEEEERRKREERARTEREIRERDQREAAERERRTSERNQQIAQQRQHERQTQQRLSKQQSEQEMMNDVASDEQERRQRSASIKNERQVEMANLIAQRNAAGMEPSQKVGSNYRKIDPRQEIETNSRDKYWMNLEAEEARRREDDKQRRANETAALERNRKEREAEDAKRREEMERERSAAIAQQRQAERDQSLRDKQGKDAQARAIHQEAIADEQERQSRSERLRRERQEEAARLIGQRGEGSSVGGGVKNARNFFLQQQQRQSEDRPTDRPAPRKLPHMGAAPVQQPQPISQPDEQPAPQVYEPPVQPPAPQPVYQPPAPQPVYQPPAPQPVYQPPAPQPVYQPPAQQPEPESSGWSDEEEAQPVQSYNPAPVIEPEPVAAPEPSQGGGDFRCEAIYDYDATEDDEISFVPGDIITEVEQIDDGWWMGNSPDGHRGLFPSNYVRPI